MCNRFCYQPNPFCFTPSSCCPLVPPAESTYSFNATFNLIDTFIPFTTVTNLTQKTPYNYGLSDISSALIGPTTVYAQSGLKINKNGVYRVRASIGYQNATVATQFQLGIQRFRGASEITLNTNFNNNPGATVPVTETQSIEWTGSLSAGDTIGIFFRRPSTTASSSWVIVPPNQFVIEYIHDGFYAMTV